MAGAAAGLEAAGAIFNAASYYQQGKISRMLGKYQRRENYRAAKDVIASGQRVMLEERRNAQLLASRALAVAGASGGGVDDPTVEKIISDIEGEGAYREASAMYEAEAQARKLRQEGDLAAWEGNVKQRQANLGALGSLVGGGGSAYGEWKKPS